VVAVGISTVFWMVAGLVVILIFCVQTTLARLRAVAIGIKSCSPIAEIAVRHLICINARSDLGVGRPMSVHAKTAHQKRRIAVDVHSAVAVGLRTEPAEEERDASEHDLAPAVGIVVAVGIQVALRR
jgi:hypothetical protein